MNPIRIAFFVAIADCNPEIVNYNVEIPPCNAEITECNTEIPPCNLVRPSCNAEIGACNAEITHFNLEIPSCSIARPSCGVGVGDCGYAGGSFCYGGGNCNIEFDIFHYEFDALGKKVKKLKSISIFSYILHKPQAPSHQRAAQYEPDTA